MAATYQTEVDALLLAIVTAEDGSTPSKTLVRNRDQTMHDTAFAESFVREFLDGVKQSPVYNGSAVLQSLDGKLNQALIEVINKAV